MDELVIDTPLAKSHVILTEPPAGSTTQPGDDDPDLGTPDDAITPPESMERLALWSAINGTRRSCIEAMAKNTVGLGYDIEVEEGHENDGEDDPREQLRLAAATLEALSARDTRLEAPSFTDQVQAVKTDEEETGWGVLEVSRNRTTGRVDGLFHLPAKRVRRLKNRLGYLLLPPSGDSNDATYFAPFGTKVAYAEGQPTAELAEGHPGGWRRNEVLVFKLYTSESRDYGLPRDHALAVEYLGDKLASESNAAFFENGGALPTVLFVQGDEDNDGQSVNVRVPTEVTQRINEVLKSRGRGPGGTGRLAIVPLPRGVKAQKEVLGQVSDRDIGFVGFRDDMRQRTLSAFRISPIFIALMEDSRYGAEVERAITKEQVFDGEQDRYETRLTNTILRDAGFPHLTIRFRDLAVEDDAARRSSAEKMGETSTITRRDYRKAHGYPPMPEAPKADADIEWEGATYKSAEPEGGQVPYGWNDRMVTVAQPDGARNRVVEGEGAQGLRPGLGGRDSKDKGQAASAAQTARLAGSNGAKVKGAAQRALLRARTLPEDG